MVRRNIGRSAGQIWGATPDDHARGIQLTEMESRLEADLDMLGALAISEEVPNGLERIRVALRVKGDAPDVELRALVDRANGRSVVYDMLSNAVPVAAEVSTA